VKAALLSLLITAGGPETIDSLAKKVGQELDGKVIKVMPTGAFVDVGGVSGLVHVSDLGWSGEKDATKLVKPGQVLRVRIVSVDVAKKRVELTAKKNEDAPWKTAAARYKVGQSVAAKVSSVVAMGVFFELEPTVEALVLESDLPAGKKSADFVVGQAVKLRISAIDVAQERISGTLK